MSNFGFLNWYYEVNLLIAIMGFVWFLSNGIWNYLGQTPMQNLRLKISRLLFVSILVCPLIIKLLPDVDVVKNTLGDFDQHLETGKALIPRLDFSREIVLMNNELLPKSASIDLLILLLFIGLSVRVLFSLRSIAKLTAIIKNGLLWKKAGKLRIIISDQITIPFSTVIFGACHIVIPVSLVTQPRDLRTVIHHEGLHHRNHDTRWVLILELAKIAFYWNPAIYFWCNYFETTHEFACDEMLITQKNHPLRNYGDALIRFSESVSAANDRLVGAVNMSSRSFLGTTNNSQLKRRIQMLSKYKKTNFSALRVFIFGLPFILFSLTTASSINNSKFNSPVSTRTEPETIGKRLEDRSSLLQDKYNPQPPLNTAVKGCNPYSVEELEDIQRPLVAQIIRRLRVLYQNNYQTSSITPEKDCNPDAPEETEGIHFHYGLTEKVDVELYPNEMIEKMSEKMSAISRILAE